MDALAAPSSRTGRNGPAGLFRRPRAVGVLCVVGLAVLGWGYLGTLIAPTLAREAAGFAPAAGFYGLLAWPGWDRLGAALAQAVCGPLAGSGATGWNFADAAFVVAMWCAMTLAMMVPTAAPMVTTYADLAETADAAGEAAVSPAVLVAGYVAVWFGFALAAAGLQRALAGAPFDSRGAAGNLVAGAILLGAGAYQFSPLKYACLHRCQRPFPFFFANWTTRRGGVFRLGVRQGLYCLGCCWAMMLVMLAAGTMNIVWMAGLGALMAAEKLTTGRTFSRVIGAGFLAAGAALALSGFELAA